MELLHLLFKTAVTILYCFLIWILFIKQKAISSFTGRNQGRILLLLSIILAMFISPDISDIRSVLFIALFISLISFIAIRLVELRR